MISPTSNPRSMASSLSPLSPFISLDDRRIFRRAFDFTLNHSNPFLNFRKSRYRKNFGSYASVAERKIEPSWSHSDGNADDEYGGWSVVEDARIERKKVVPNILFVGAGALVAVLLAALVGRDLSRKGFSYRFNIPLHSLQGQFTERKPDAEPNRIEDETSQEYKPAVVQVTTEKDLGRGSALEKKLRHVNIPVVDSTQQEALWFLKKLEIIEDNVKPDELCTRREYARWLVKANSLERDPKHRLASFLLTAGSLIDAFDDVSVTDPDFWCIQALAEAGIIASKLVTNASCSECQGRVDFSPKSFISRLDLLNWKAQLEYAPIATDKKMLRKKVDFMDVRALDLDASPEFFMDMLVGEKSVVNRVFGRSRRLQPFKPATRAQAAVTLTSGRMLDAIQKELQRLEVENLSRLAAMESIKSEIFLKGEIQRFWEEKINEEKDHGSKVERDLLVSTQELEKERIVRYESHAEFLKEKAALDSKRELLLKLEEEVSEMCERHSRERANLEVEQKNLEDLYNDSKAKQEAILEAKSILEAEKDALRIVRAWVEDEAKELRSRGKILEEAARRWKWNDTFDVR